MEYLYSLESLRAQIGRLEADLGRRTADGQNEADLSDLRWRIQRLRAKVDAGADPARRKG